MIPPKILIVGNIYDKHICRLITHVKRRNKDLRIDIFNTFISDAQFPDMADCYDNIYLKTRHFPKFLYRVPILRAILSRAFDSILSFRRLKANRYHLLNIHFVTSESFFLMRSYKRAAKSVMASPWGSDVYRVKKIDYYMVKSVLHNAHLISAPKIQFKKDIKKIYSVPESKFVELGFGSDAIDNILNNYGISKIEAKEALGIQDTYVITCGYNGSKLQNHRKIIESIESVRKDIGVDICLLFPMTYGSTPGYIGEITSVLSSKGFKYLIFDHYLSDSELLNLRKCSDMFIHAQPSDAFSGSVQEYLLTSTKVINGVWTRYPDLEEFGMPYYIFHSFEELGGVVLKAFNDHQHQLNEKLKVFIGDKGWNAQGKQWARFYESLSKN